MKQKILFLALLISSFNVYSQKKNYEVKDYFADAEYFFTAEAYIDALEEYNEVYRRGYQENANINYHIGVCYLNIPGQKGKSVNYLLKASQSASLKYVRSTLSEVYAPIDVFLYLGNAYRVLNKLDEAVAAYNQYLSLVSPQAKDERNYALKQIEACAIAKEYLAKPENVEFVNLGKLINTNTANYNCVVSGDNNTMVYMSKLPFYDAVFMSKKRGNSWSRPVNITPQIQSDGDQVVTGISADGNTLLLAKSDEFNSDIYISYFENGQWTKSKPISKTVNTRFWESHASFSADGKTLYFTSNRTGSIGGMDIWVSELNDKGDWSEPKNLGHRVNTVLNEDTPFITADGKSLYYSSQGNVSMGGYDFFINHRADTGWSGPENLRYPLSTTDDDLFYFPFKNGETAYVHKIFDNGLGNWDIYLINFKPEIEIEESIAEAEPIKAEEKLIIEPIVTQSDAVELKPLLFGFDNYKLSDGMKTDLEVIITLLNKHKDLKIKIVGYTDALGSETYNQMLSERRATTVSNYLKSRNIDASRIEVVGLGETDFIALNTFPDGSDNPEGRKYNRRVEILLVNSDKYNLMVKKIDIVPENLRIEQK